eukprot:CAMPEP_0118861650 /NCGR_PEP_ID=MMETSP1163-20130328/7113_1 /TAXON_ID=124430 /ORGANISM="Phaeomonas parva, Strain CCMP2877" /LENGTH=651 /DNA_ID=CAMNT_0006795481 /DNA_START=50 /DNA_END=2005 /DNA_ORIENTATION=+
MATFAEGADASALPPCKLMLGTDSGLTLRRGLPTAATEEEEKGFSSAGLPEDPAMAEPMGVGILHVADDGSMLACADAEDVWVRRTSGDGPDEVFRAANPRTMALAFSSKCTYLLAWQRWDQADTAAGAGAGGGNLKVFRVADGAVVGSYMLRKRVAEAWPAIQWSADEAFCTRMVTNEVRIETGLFDGGQRPEPITRIRLERVQGFALSPGAGYPLRVATYTPQAKGGSPPPRVAIWHWTPSEGAEAADPMPVATKTLTRAEEVELDWSPTGSGVLIRTSSAVDHSGDSYYGGTGLFLMAGDGSFDCIVTPPKEGKIEDAQWSPNGREFVLVAGSQPAKATLFNLKGEGVFDFGTAHRNTVKWAPHGRFLMLGGFGNLVGEMTFWDRNKLKPMGTTEAPTPATTYGWSADSRYFLTATTRPRMNVENSVHLFRYNGEGPLLSQHFEYLTLAQWLPGSEIYPDRPQSPLRLKRKKKEAKEGKPTATAAKPAGRYVPPSARGSTGATSRVAEQLRAEHDAGSSSRKLSGVKAYRPPGAGVPGMPVGAPQPKTETKSKAAKARERRRRKEEEKKAAEAAAMVAAAAAPAPAPAEPVDPAKKLKKLQKKQKQILALKAKIDAGEALDEDQRKKLETLGAVAAEIAELEAQIASA